MASAILSLSSLFLALAIAYYHPRSWDFDFNSLFDSSRCSSCIRACLTLELVPA